MLEKIKEFFRNLFNKNKKLYIEETKEVTETINDSQDQMKIEFESQIEFKNEDEKVLKVQKDFEDLLINPEELSDEDFDALVKLYEKQIKVTKESIKGYKNKIEMMRAKLSENN